MCSAKRHSLGVWKTLKDVPDRLLANETEHSKIVPDDWEQDHPQEVRG